MNKSNFKTVFSIKSILVLLQMTFIGLVAHAYPSSSIVDSLPGVYQGFMQGTDVVCEVNIKSNLDMMSMTIKLLDGSNRSIAFESVSHLRLKRVYEENYRFRKEQDKHFDQELSNAWLIHQVNQGIPSFFGVYPRTDKLEVDWDKDNLFGVMIAISYSNGGPVDVKPEERNQNLSCIQLNRI